MPRRSDPDVEGGPGRVARELKAVVSVFLGGDTTTTISVPIIDDDRRHRRARASERPPRRWPGTPTAWEPADAGLAEVALRGVALSAYVDDRPRDRALLAVGYDTLLRRAELVSLKVADFLEEFDGTATVLVRAGKPDQEGRGATLSWPATPCNSSRRGSRSAASTKEFRSVEKDK